MIGSFIRKLLKRNNESQLDRYLKSGQIRIGHGCDLSGMSLFIVDPNPQMPMLVIGNNTCVRGTIVLYQRESKVVLGNDVYIGPSTLIECVSKISIGNNVLISTNCNVIDTNSHSLHSEQRMDDTKDWQKGLRYKNWKLVQSKEVLIDDKCWIGLRSIILKGVHLGEGTIVAAGSVVTKNTTPFTIVGGNPASIISHTD